MSAAGRLLRWIADRPTAIAPLLVLGIAIRLAWSLAGHVADLDTELRNAAIHWAATGWIADAFQPGSGPTAHVGLLPVLISGLVYRLFAIGPVASLILTTMSAATVVATAFVLNRVFARLGTSATWRGAAVLLVCLLPLHIEIESRSLRIYENGTAALLLALMLWAIVAADQRQRVTVRDTVGLSMLAALTLAISPISGAVGIAMLGILALRRLDWRGRGIALGTLALALTVTTLPWAARNAALMGEAVPTRSNFGLEFAIGTHAAAVAPEHPDTVYLARLAQIHPHDSPAGYAAMRAAGGEIAYARQLRGQTWAWVVGHPGEALQIWARHLREFYFPPFWMWLHSGVPDATTPLRIVLVDLIAVLALVGLASALARRQWLFLYLLPPVVLLPLLYVVSQPLVRYRYAIASLLVFLAADALGRLRQKT